MSEETRRLVGATSAARPCVAALFFGADEAAGQELVHEEDSRDEDDERHDNREFHGMNLLVQNKRTVEQAYEIVKAIRTKF